MAGWQLYWFMFPACIVIAATATFSGISGAALMTPFFLLGFPLLGRPALSTVAAIGAALFLETSGFGAGVYHYLKRSLADVKAAKSLMFVTVPFAVIGAILAHHAPTRLLRLVYGAVMIGVAWMLHQGGEGRKADCRCPCLVCHSDRSGDDCPPERRREIRTSEGRNYTFCPEGLLLQHLFSGIGAFMAGLISTGVGEATLPPLVRRSRYPPPVAAATSTLVVAGTVLGASVTHFLQLAQTGGLSAIPWSVIAWGAPGAVIGAAIGTRFQGRFSEQATRTFFSLLFLGIGILFLAAFTIFKKR